MLSVCHFPLPSFGSKASHYPISLDLGKQEPHTCGLRSELYGSICPISSTERVVVSHLMYVTGSVSAESVNAESGVDKMVFIYRVHWSVKPFWKNGVIFARILIVDETVRVWKSTTRVTTYQEWEEVLQSHVQFCKVLRSSFVYAYIKPYWYYTVHYFKNPEKFKHYG